MNMIFCISNPVSRTKKMITSSHNQGHCIVKKITIAVFLLINLVPFYAWPAEGDPSACDCKTIVISDDEAKNGCPASVKRETCPLFRDSEQWQQKLEKQRELKNMEDRMNPGRTGAYPRH